MSTSGTDLQGFAYGEHLEEPHGRSLGYRLLAPAAGEVWGPEVEALARRLQAAPYPDHWPPTELFCSVLLADGRRLIAAARYGLADHTPSQRRSGLELIGVVGPSSISVPTALAVYHWLKQRRAQTEDLRALGGSFSLAEVLSAVPPAPPPADPVPVLPIRLWQEGALLFAATAPSDPDHRLGLLEQNAAETWQWLPLIGEDFPVQTLAQRGPLVAWTPHLAGVAVVLRNGETETGRAGEVGHRRFAVSPPRRFARGALVLVLLLLFGMNLWALLSAHGLVFPWGNPATKAAPPDDSQERFAEALDRLIQEQGDWAEGEPVQKEFRVQYDRVVRNHEDLRLRESNSKGKAAVGAVSVLLAQRKRSAEQVKKLVEKALADKDFSDKLSRSIAEKVYQQLMSESKE
jgi:hypothetical protein